ncbi:antibiotic biosynthesis monooxygenase [Pseudomonas sp. Z1-29]|uniref:antibiotic biosynthesis monooxygenase n=1 Tax=Pseudomonas sp. Z1-29 TaxID=2817410 RepID=UPI003DA7EA82
MSEVSGVVVSHIIRPAHEQAFVEWAKKMAERVRAAPGFRSIIRLDQGPAISHTLVQFDSQEQLDCWLASDAFLLLRAEAMNYSLRIIQPQAGQTGAISIPGSASMPKWKQAAATWLGVYPTLVAVNIFMIRPLADSVNWLVLLTASSLSCAI